MEHTQLLLFLFHALALMQKKQVLLLTAVNVCKSAKVINRNSVLRPSQILHLSRLVLLFEYLMRNLYEPPKDLMEHVQSNIFQKYTTTSILSSPPKHFPFNFAAAVKDMDLNLDKLYPDQDHRSRPRYYNLFNVTDLPSIQEIPKLDGLACSFILATTELLQYNQIYNSLITILQVIHQTDQHK